MIDLLLEKKKLGIWFKEKMKQDTLFPNPAHIVKFFPESGSIESFKDNATKIAEETRIRYIKCNVSIPKNNIYETEGRQFWITDY